MFDIWDLLQQTVEWPFLPPLPKTEVFVDVSQSHGSQAGSEGFPSTKLWVVDPDLSHVSTLLVSFTLVI